MREVLDEALKSAMKAQDRTRMATLRLIACAIKDRDIEARVSGRDSVTDDEILSILAKMIRQREESSALYDEAGRADLAGQERAEIEIIRSFLPRQMPEEEVKAVCRGVVDEVGAHGLRDMGKCMGALKARYAGRMDFGKASAVVKDMLR